MCIYLLHLYTNNLYINVVLHEKHRAVLFLHFIFISVLVQPIGLIKKLAKVCWIRHSFSLTSSYTCDDTYIVWKYCKKKLWNRSQKLFPPYMKECTWRKNVPRSLNKDISFLLLWPQISSHKNFKYNRESFFAVINFIIIYNEIFFVLFLMQDFF